MFYFTNNFLKCLFFVLLQHDQVKEFNNILIYFIELFSF